jgi:hypothetical protein
VLEDRAQVAPIAWRSRGVGAVGRSRAAGVKLWREVIGRRAIEIPIPVAGKLGRALREGRPACANPDVRGTLTFAAWLQVNAP